MSSNTNTGSRNTMSLTAVKTQMSQVANPAAERLQALVQSKLTEDRLGVVVDKLLSKAESGDTRALDYLLTISGMKPTAPQQVTINNFYEGDTENPETLVVERGEATPEMQVTTYLSCAGPSSAAMIADQIGLPVDQVIKILDNNPRRFDVDGKLYRLKKGR
jgi:hypothetical protein